MRRAFANALLEEASRNRRVIFLTADLGFQVFDAFREKFPGRYINVGVAEAQLVCAAAGLALEGWRPVIYSIASFMTARPFEQIRVCASYSNLPIVIVGAGGGYTYASSGVTHHAPDDLALMSLLPNLAVVAPGDPNEVSRLLPQLLERPGPSYMRIGKFGEASYAAESPVVLGRARLLRQGRRVAALSTGDSAVALLQAADILAAEGIVPALYQIHTVKPLDLSALEAVAEEFEVVVTVEEHAPSGGLGAAVGQWLAGRPRAPRWVRLGPPDAHALGNPRRADLQKRLGYDAAALVDAVRAAWRECRLP